MRQVGRGKKLLLPFLFVACSVGGCSADSTPQEEGTNASESVPAEVRKQNWELPKMDGGEGEECDSAASTVCQGDNGVAGTCIRGHCLANGPGCIRDVDCFDGNDCTLERCDQGKCVSSFTTETCEVASRKGTCTQGKCILDGALACSKDKDCEPVSTPCRDAFCSEGVCDFNRLEAGEICEMHSGAPGVCNAGEECVFDEAVAEAGADICRMRWVWSGYRRVKKKRCRKGLRYRISSDRLAEQREKIRGAIENEVRYDTHVGLIQLADGGYNINVSNARKREDIRGLVDPSFVAFSLASFTSKTNWKSRNLNIWLSPLLEGWTIPTSGSRKAIKKGKAASALGHWGVVHVKTYRKWLEKNFSPLPIPIPQ